MLFRSASEILCVPSAMHWRMKSVTNLKSSILVYFCVHFFISGVDSYIILPTAWYYIRSLGFSKSFYGAVIAAQSLGFILFTPVVGKISDKTRAVKSVLLACVFVKVSANLVYAIPVSGYCPLVGYFFLWSCKWCFWCNVRRDGKIHVQRKSI